MINWGDVGGMLGAFAGLVSALVAWRALQLSARISREQMGHSRQIADLQAQAGRALSKESSASAIYDAYLRCCIEYPHLTSFNTFCNSRSIKSPQRIWDAETEQTEQYLWFVSYLLHACEGILVDASDKEDWLEAIRDQLDYHWGIIEYAWEPHWRQHYSPSLNEQVQLVLQNHSRRLKHA